MSKKLAFGDKMIRPTIRADQSDYFPPWGVERRYILYNYLKTIILDKGI